MAAAGQPLLRVSEPEVGITAHLNPDVPGFHGKFKEKWQDFHVHEVDSSGTELHLSELITPGLVSSELKAAATARKEALAALGPEFTPAAEVETQLQSALGDSATAKLIAFLRSQRPTTKPAAARSPPAEAGEAAAQSAGASAQEAAGGSASSTAAAGPAAAEPPSYVDLEADKLGDGSKEARKNAHKAILEGFDTVLNTETVDVDGVRQVRVWMRDAERRVKSLPGQQAEDSGGGGKGGKGGKGKGKKGKGKGKKGRGKSEGDGGENAGGGEFGTLRREGWPKDRPKYLYFRLYKENCNTSEAVSNIAGVVGRSPKQFSFAGTKDKRASTVQLISARKLPAEALRRALANRAWDRRLRVSDMDYRAEKLRLGQLHGNRFNIALRGVAAEAVDASGEKQSVVAGAMAAASAHGFLNYFGLQRFGTREVRTHSVGAAILAKDYAKAARLILGEGFVADEADKVPTGEHSSGSAGKRKAEEAPEGEPPAKAAKHDDSVAMDTATADASAAAEKKVPKWKQIKDAAKLFLEGNDTKAALQAMPKSQHLERCILGAFDRGLRGEEILRQLPHQALSLYAHAAQSLIWNAVLSRRIAELGAKPVVGDLVLAKPGDALLAADEVLDGDDAMAGDNEAADEASDAEEDADGAGQLPEVRELTEEDLASGAKLSDVVLPLPGHSVRYPAKLKGYYEEAAKQLLGLSLEEFHDATLVPLRGAYRAMVVRPADLTWKALAAEEVHAAEAARKPLQQTDVARLLDARGEVPEAPGAAAAAAEEPKQEHRDKAEEAAPPVSQASAATAAQGGSSAAVVFSCVLPPSAYLTMFLRELTKLSTASPQLLG
eukprot:TRINITY_DN16874_c0_g2_i1.p1 TRINITY_DN16874_c0_g2~~TRINITY_DN16874_c0_g2_i1.p1  ORF type:complete len:855 (-),score=275.82 TRINITY_DN16874_c0_g2_i1:177-2684(-)